MGSCRHTIVKERSLSSRDVPLWSQYWRGSFLVSFYLGVTIRTILTPICYTDSFGFERVLFDYKLSWKVRVHSIIKGVVMTGGNGNERKRLVLVQVFPVCKVESKRVSEFHRVLTFRKISV